MIKRFKSLKTVEKVNCVFLFVMSAFYIVYGIYSFLNPIVKTTTLLSIVIVILGVLCFQVVLEKYLSLKDIDELLNKLITDSSYLGNTQNIVELSTREKFEKSHPLEDRFKNAKCIYMFSHSNYAIFQPGYISYVIDGIRFGTSFKFIGFNPFDIEKIKNLKQYKMVQQLDDNPSLTSLNNYLKIKKENSFTDEQIQFNICDIDFPFGMTIVHKLDGEITVKVDLYTIKTRHFDRRCIFLSSNNYGQKELIDFFINQWEEAWKESKRSCLETQ